MPQLGGRKPKKGKYQKRRLYLHQKTYEVLDRIKEMKHPELTQSKFIEALVEPFNPEMELKVDRYDVIGRRVFMQVRNQRREALPITAVLCNGEVVDFEINTLNPIPPKGQYGGVTVVGFRLPKGLRKDEFTVTLQSTLASSSFGLSRKGTRLFGLRARTL